LYEEPDKPSDALSFVRNIFAASEMQTMRSQVENLTKENEQLKTKVSTLETDKAVLEKKIVQMEEVVAAAKDEKKDESPASPKQVDEGDVSNETPQVNTGQYFLTGRPKA
jgi:outer membrane murein-binding lipoprotein Lpp